MAYLENKIRQVKEITSTTTEIPYSAFYVYVMQKSSTAASAVIMGAKLSGDTTSKDVPFTSLCWNPIVVNELTVTLDNLTDYRIFVGAE